MDYSDKINDVLRPHGLWITRHNPGDGTHWEIETRDGHLLLNCRNKKEVSAFVAGLLFEVSK